MKRLAESHGVGVGEEYRDAITSWIEKHRTGDDHGAVTSPIAEAVR